MTNDQKDWLDRLFTDGEVELTGPPAAASEATLRRAHAAHALDVAGPPLPFDAAVARAAADWFGRACWTLVGPDEPGDDLKPLGEPASPAAHLSADLTLRFLPAVLSRARLYEADDPLGRAV